MCCIIFVSKDFGLGAKVGIAGSKTYLSPKKRIDTHLQNNFMKLLIVGVAIEADIFHGRTNLTLLFRLNLQSCSLHNQPTIHASDTFKIPTSYQ